MSSRGKKKGMKSALENRVDKLNGKDVILIELMAIKKFNEYVNKLGKVLDNSFFNAMRDTRVGEERAYKILEKAKKIIELETERMGR